MEEFRRGLKFEQHHMLFFNIPYQSYYNFSQCHCMNVALNILFLFFSFLFIFQIVQSEYSLLQCLQLPNPVTSPGIMKNYEMIYQRISIVKSFLFFCYQECYRMYVCILNIH